MKTKHLFLAFFFSTFAFISYGQQVVYNETYSNKDGDWPEGNNSNRELEVKNGKYYFEHKRTDKNWNVRTPDLNIDLSGDFEIETSIERISFNNKNHAFGLMFGNKDDENTFHFYLSDNQYRVSDKRNNEYVNYKGWVTSSAINTGTYATNKFKVKKVGSKISFYINGTFLKSKDYNTFKGKKIGIYIFDKQKVAIDYIKVNQLNGNPVVVNNTNSKSKSILFEGFNDNKNNWSVTNSSDVNLNVTAGDYVFDHKRSSGGWSSTINKKYDASKNFRVSAQFKKQSGIQNNGYGLVLGRNDGDNQNQFYISGKGSFSISKHVNGTRTYIKEWTSSSHIKTGNGATNTLTIKRTGSKVEYLINSKVVYTSYSYKSYGDRTGFVVYDKQKINIAYLSITGHPIGQVQNNITTTTTSGNSILDDDFTSNKTNWAVSDDKDATLEIKNNRYYFEHKRTSGGWSSTKTVDIDTRKDFEIESQFLKIGGITNNGYGFVFGRKDGNNQFVFTITSNGQYSIDQYDNGKYIALKKWTKTEHIKTGEYAYNTLKIKKERGFIKFYINDRYLTLYTHKPFYGKRLGFIVYNDQKIAINNLKVKYINNSVVKNNVVTTTTTSGGVILKDDFSSNKNNWAESTRDEADLDIRNGKYYFNHKRDSKGWTSTNVVKIDDKKDFEIESKFLRPSLLSILAITIIFCLLSSNKSFLISKT